MYGRLVRPDGSVVVPGEIADGLLRLLVLGVTTASQRNAGGRPSPAVLEVLHALNMAAVKADEAPVSVNGPSIGEMGIIEVHSKYWKSSAEAAGLLQCTERSVRRACVAGKLPARKVGRQWLISEEDLDTYRFGKAA
ncbi:helix-turn-helix domain-containing protein [Micrococcaceae bacterium Sec5.7]